MASVRDIFINVKYVVDNSPLKKATKVATAELKKVEKGVLNTRLSIHRLAVFWLTLRTFKGLADAADEWRGMANDIKAVTNNLEEAEAVQQRIAKTAREIGSSFTDVSDIFVGVRANFEDKGLADQVQFTRAIAGLAQASTESNASAQRIMQSMTKALSSGQLKGNEIKTLMKKTPLFGQKLASIMGYASVQEMVQRLNEEPISAEAFFDTIIGNKEKVENAIDGISGTWARGGQRIKSSIAEFLGKIDEATGAGQKFSDITKVIAENIDIVGTAVASIATAIGVLKLGSSIAAIGGIKAAVGALMSTLWPLTAIAAVAFGLFAIIQDIWLFFQGDADTLTGHLFKRSQEFRQTFLDIYEAVQVTVEAGRKLWKTLKDSIKEMLRSEDFMKFMKMSFRFVAWLIKSILWISKLIMDVMSAFLSGDNEAGGRVIYNAAKDVINGIIGYIKSMSPKTILFILAVAAAALVAFLAGVPSTVIAAGVFIIVTLSKKIYEYLTSAISGAIERVKSSIPQWMVDLVTKGPGAIKKAAAWAKREQVESFHKGVQDNVDYMNRRFYGSNYVRERNNINQNNKQENNIVINAPKGTAEDISKAIDGFFKTNGFGTPNMPTVESAP